MVTRGSASAGAASTMPSAVTRSRRTATPASMQATLPACGSKVWRAHGSCASKWLMVAATGVNSVAAEGTGYGGVIVSAQKNRPPNRGGLDLTSLPGNISAVRLKLRPVVQARYWMEASIQTVAPDIGLTRFHTSW